MQRLFVEFLTAIATDSNVLADYQTDPDETMARFGLGERDMNEFIENMSEQTSARDGVVASRLGPVPVTH